MFKQMADLWIDLVFWWVPRERQALETSDAAAVPSEVEAHEDLVPEPKLERVAADLTVIRGIGPALQKKLVALNIMTFGDLAEADPHVLTEKLKESQPISPSQVRAWAESARELAQA